MLCGCGWQMADGRWQARGDLLQRYKWVVAVYTFQRGRKPVDRDTGVACPVDPQQFHGPFATCYDYPAYHPLTKGSATRNLASNGTRTNGRPGQQPHRRTTTPNGTTRNGITRRHHRHPHRHRHSHRPRHSSSHTSPVPVSVPFRVCSESYHLG